MKIFIITSKKFYGKIPEIKLKLEKMGHRIVLPNSYDDIGAEDRQRTAGALNHARWKAMMIRQSETEIKKVDAVLVLNFEKNGIQNYIGGATFLKMHDAFRLKKKIFMYNLIPEGILTDEIIGFGPQIIMGDLTKVT